MGGSCRLLQAENLDGGDACQLWIVTKFRTGTGDPECTPFWMVKCDSYSDPELQYTVGLDKNLVGDFLGNHDDFCVQILHELAWTFDFQDMNVDTALRLFLETVTLPGESHKLQRALEAFSER
ncbi:GUANYL-NUCLEOTIDE EXCHANGE FACTOR [Salix koriyanagi]|uniref:GUANYL-NUCLEOTIDE EXCHANGE FACTOR n=1 Tax=Salix koriyanagi TaxID=2511006 RepID=A0A9Q0UYQ0_9ROSI|nr:GUANYL-NUCLEOTIDE EXCHANGE FACTOR [Salix koriyanagi]